MATVNGIKFNNAKLPNLDLLMQLGLDPKTGLPLRAINACSVKDNIKTMLRIQDEQDACRTFEWGGLPHGITSELLERILFYRGRACLFYMPSENKFYFLPFAYEADHGGLDCYNRYTSVSPIPFNGSGDDKKAKPWIPGLHRKPVYDMPLYTSIEDVAKGMEENCIILYDYIPQMSQTILPRQQINEGIIDIESDCIPFMRTAMLNSTGVMGMRVGSEDEQSSVVEASASVNNAALNGNKYIPVVGAVDFQDLSGGDVAKSEEFLLAMQAIDNIRVGTHGLANGGIFQKKAHELQSEANMNGGLADSVLTDRLACRQAFCEFANATFGTGIWVRPREQSVGIDYNADGDAVSDSNETPMPEEEGGVQYDD